MTYVAQRYITTNVTLHDRPAGNGWVSYKKFIVTFHDTYTVLLYTGRGVMEFYILVMCYIVKLSYYFHWILINVNSVGGCGFILYL